MTVLFVVTTILVFLTIDFFVRRARERKNVRAVATVPGAAVHSIPVRIPEGIFFAPSHTWLNIVPSGKVYLGVDDFVSRLLDKPRVTLLNKEGDKVRKGDPIVLLQEDGRELTIHAPVDGEILSVNEPLQSKPEMMKELLFTDGWAYLFKPKRPSELKNMLLGEETRQWLAEEFRRLRDVFAGISQHGELVPALLQDGGPPVAGVMKQMPESVWNRFEREFLEVH
ncbi:MAG TPA: biotin/lipoyl-containing protein [Bacteroidota bacterium]|nr:biotin/lipoyl-containing protein [Bacteroidota bacterium]